MAQTVIAITWKRTKNLTQIGAFRSGLAISVDYDCKPGRVISPRPGHFGLVLLHLAEDWLQFFVRSDRFSNLLRQGLRLVDMSSPMSGETKVDVDRQGRVVVCCREAQELVSLFMAS